MPTWHGQWAAWVWNASVLCLLALAAPVMGQELDGRMRTIDIAPMPEGRAVEIRPFDSRLPNRNIEALLAEEMRGRGFAIEIGAPIVLGYRATGVFSQLKSDGSWLRLQGRIGNSSEPTGSMSITLPDFGGSETKPRPHAIELRAEDQPGTRYWEAHAAIDSKSEQPGQIARILVAAMLEHWGRSHFGPVLR